MIVRAESSSHWYTRSGAPCYEIPMKTKPGQFRQPTVTDARKMGLVPSVTTILGMVRKPGLEVYRRTQDILAALTLPRREGESLDAFAERVIADADEHSKDAMGTGTMLHGALELFHRGMDPGLEPVYLPALEAYREWVGKAGFVPQDIEKPFAHPLGFGGRVDAWGHLREHIGVVETSTPVVIDWKTTSTEKGKKVTGYDEWPIQLSAYAVGLFGANAPKARLLNVVISTTEIGRVEVIEQTGKFAAAWDAFDHLLRAWTYFKGYDPAGEAEAEGRVA